MNGAPKLNIRQRLWIALGLLASSTLFVGGVAWFSLYRANIGLETLHQQTLSEVARVLRLSRQSSDIAASAPFLLSYPSAYLIEKEGKSLAQTLQQVADDWHSAGAEPNFEVAAFHDEINAAISAMKTAIEELAVSAEALTVEREATETLAKRLGGVENAYYSRAIKPSIGDAERREWLSLQAMANELVGAAHAENLLGVGEHRRNFQRLSRLFDEGAVELSKAREVVDMMDLAYGREGLFESRRRELSKQLAAQNALFRIRSNASLINNLSGSFAGNAERILSAERDKTTSAIGFAKIVILATGVGAVLIALASAMFVARYVTANITSISNAMMRLAQGDRATRLPQKLAANDEIGILQRSFRVFRANALRLDRTNQRLNRQNALFERVFLNITDGVAITDPEGRLTAVNPSFSKTLRLDPSLNPVGAEIQVVLRSSILAENKSNWRFDESFAGFSEIHGDNGLVIEIRRNALPEGGGVWLFSDATERRQVQDRLRQIQHIEGLGKVAGEVAHDFGNILSSIASNVHLVEQSRTNAQTDTYFYRMRNALEIGTSLVQRLLAFAKKQALMPEVIDLNELIAGLIDLIEVSLKDGVALETQPGVGPNYVLADPGQLESAILNLCLNADQSIKSAGRIRVSIRRPDKSTTVVSVTDTGSGMDKATQLRAFEPFFSTRSGENGTGLGLAMVYGFMKQSGGDAAICSKCGIGTKVSLSFPTAQVASETPREIASGQTALLVEDDPDTMRQTASCLENEGFSVTPASTLEGAMTHLDKIEHLDLLVTDLNLDDGKTGWPLVKQCEDKFADCQIIVVSGRLPERFFDGCEQLKARTVALVEKPFSQEKLESALQGRRCGACA